MKMRHLFSSSACCFSYFCQILLLSALLKGSFLSADAFEPLPAVFPVSTRQALVEKAKNLNAPILEKTAPSSGDSSSSSYYQYGTAGWSNRAATVLTPQAPGIWTADRPFYWNNIDVGCRCTVIELPSSSSSSSSKPELWVHSPVALDGPMKQACDTLGTVKYVVSPNYEHVKYAPQWSQGYAEKGASAVEMWACPGLAERKQDVQWAGEIPFGCRPVGWKGSGGASTLPGGKGWDVSVLQPLHVNIEKNPFTGKAFFNEVIYYHAPSKALMMTDFYWNYPRDNIPNSQFGRDDTWELAPSDETTTTPALGSRLWKFGMDQVYYPFFNSFMVNDRDEYKAIANHIVNEWDVEMVIPAHGDVLRGKEFIKDVLSRHFQLK